LVAPNWLIGIEADISAADLRGSVVAPNGPNRHDHEDNLFGTVRGRLGYAMSNLLFYSTGEFRAVPKMPSRMIAPMRVLGLAATLMTAFAFAQAVAASPPPLFVYPGPYGFADGRALTSPQTMDLDQVIRRRTAGDARAHR
jgi:hypothetical protein